MPSKRQVSLTLSAAADRAVRKRMKAGAGNKSRVVSQIIERYVATMRVSRVDLEPDELEHLARLTEGWTLDYSTATALPTLASTADVPEDLDVRKSRLVAKLQAAGAVGWVQVIEQLEAKGASNG